MVYATPYHCSVIVIPAFLSMFIAHYHLTHTYTVPFASWIERPRGFELTLMWRNYSLLLVVATSLISLPRWKSIVGLVRTALFLISRAHIRSTDHISGSGERLFEKLEVLKLEGMMIQRKIACTPLCCRDWLKVRTSAGRVTMQKRIENWS